MAEVRRGGERGLLGEYVEGSGGRSSWITLPLPTPQILHRASPPLTLPLLSPCLYPLRWTDLIDTAPIPATASFKSIIVPTADSVTVTYLLNTAVENG